MRPRSFPLITLFLTLALCASCGSHRTAVILDDVETYIQDRPDSALATIRAIDTTTLKTRALRAHYALLYAMALDKNWIDTADVNVVMPAVNYYDHKGSIERKSQTWYCLGRLQQNGGDYAAAIASMMKAREMAANFPDSRLHAMIHGAIATLYRNSQDYLEARHWDELAYGYSRKARDSVLLNTFRYGIALDFQHLKRYDISDLLFQVILADSTHVHPHLYLDILNNFALLKTTEREYAEACKYYEQAIAVRNGLESPYHWGAYAFALTRTGDNRRADSIFHHIETQADNLSFQYWKSRTLALTGNYPEAYTLQEKAFDLQTQDLEEILQQSVVKAQRDIFMLQNDALKRENKLRNWIIVLLVITFLASSGTVFAFIRKYRDRVQFQNRQLMETAEELLEQRQRVKGMADEIHETRRQQAKVRQEYFYLSQENFKELSSLCNTYYKTEGHSSQADSVCGEVRGFLKRLGVGLEHYPVFEQRINETFDHVMQHFREEHPGHRERYFQTACFLFAGFKNRTAAMLLHLDEQDIYQTRWRLKKEIESTPSPHQNDFLSLLGVSE